MPDAEGDSATFLNFFLPNQALALKAVQHLVEAGIGVNYWFTNMYHFINQWDHLKNLKSPFKMAIHHLGAPQDYQNLQLPQSQHSIGRLISLGIKANWKQDELEQISNKMIDALRKSI